MMLNESIYEYTGKLHFHGTGQSLAGNSRPHAHLSSSSTNQKEGDKSRIRLEQTVHM